MFRYKYKRMINKYIMQWDIDVIDNFLDDIAVIDNFLDDIELKQAVSIISSKSWVFGHKSTHSAIAETPYWSASLLDEKYFSEYIKEIIENDFYKNLKYADYI